MDPKTELAPEEIVAVNKLRANIADVLPELDEFQCHDLGLIRFLRARELNMEKAEDMLRKHLQWKQNNEDTDVYSKDIPQDLCDAFPVLFPGVDQEGHPIVVVPVGQYNIRKTVEEHGKEAILRFVCQIFELALDLCRKLTTEEKYVSQVSVVLDFEGFSFFQLASKEVIELVLAVVRIFEANYPEILRRAMCINTPKVFQILWSAVKPLLTRRTLDKIHIHSGNKSAWKEDIFTLIHPTHFPSQYGGSNLTTPLLILNCGADRLLAIHECPLFPESQLEAVTIEARKRHQVEVDAEKGMRIQWNFKSQDCDVGFQLQLQESKDSVIDYTRVDSHVYTQKGEIVCRESGKYIFTFDNSYSSFRSKQIQYVIKLLDENECSRIL